MPQPIEKVAIAMPRRRADVAPVYSVLGLNYEAYNEAAYKFNNSATSADR